MRSQKNKWNVYPLFARVVLIVFTAIILGNVLACGQRPEKSDDSDVLNAGVVGASCEALPRVYDAQGRNVCIIPDPNWPGLQRGHFWFSPLTVAFARLAAVKACEDANALDYGVEFGKSCFETCAKVTQCIPFTPSPNP